MMNQDTKEKLDIIINNLRFETLSILDELDQKKIKLSEVLYHIDQVKNLDKELKKLIKQQIKKGKNK